MGLFEKIRRHAAVARGDFDTMFKEVEIPPLPAAVSQLLGEINKPDPDIDHLAKLISASPEIAAKTIQTVNSSLFSPRLPVADVKRAVTLLGLKNIRSIALGYATMDALPKPPGKLFDHSAFWSDSLLQAALARALAKKKFSSQLEEVFTASLLADLAIPVLLCVYVCDYVKLIRLVIFFFLLCGWLDGPCMIIRKLQLIQKFISLRAFK